MEDNNNSELNIVEKLLSSTIFVRNARILFFSWIFFTIVILFLFRVNEERSSTFLTQFAYPIIGAMCILMILYEFGRRKYARNYSIFRYRIRDRLKGTDFEEKSHRAMVFLIPTFKARFLIKYLGFGVLCVSTYFSLFIISNYIRWLILVFGVVSLIVYNHYLNLIATEDIIKASQLG